MKLTPKQAKVIGYIFLTAGIAIIAYFILFAILLVLMLVTGTRIGMPF